MWVYCLCGVEYIYIFFLGLWVVNYCAQGRESWDAVCEFFCFFLLFMPQSLYYVRYLAVSLVVQQPLCDA